MARGGEQENAEREKGGAVGPPLRLAEGFLTGLQGLENQCVDGHGSNTSGDGGVGGYAINQWCQLDVSAPFRVEAGVHDYGSIFYRPCFDEVWLTYCAHHDVRLLDQLGQVLSTTVANSDGGISF